MTRYCLQCDDGTELVHDCRDVEITYRNHRDTVRNVAGWHCPACGEIEYDAGEGERYRAALEALADKVTAEEAALLRDVRKRLGMTQRAAEALTGGGHNAFSRYERGEARPMAAVVNLFRLLDKHPELLRELRQG